MSNKAKEKQQKLAKILQENLKRRKEAKKEKNKEE